MVKSYTKKELPFRMYEGVAGSFNELPEDISGTKALGRPFRYRRWNEFYFDDRGYLHRHDDTTTFMQSSDVNKVFGDEQRTFEPIEDYLLDSAGFQMMFDKFREHTGISERIGCHQVRITIGPEGVPAAPEGPHSDGFDFIGAFIVDRDNITDDSGEFCVWDQSQAIDDIDVYKWPEPIFRDPLWTRETRSYAILNDRDYLHTGYDLRRKDPTKSAKWDWFVITGNKGE